MKKYLPAILISLAVVAVLAFVVVASTSKSNDATPEDKQNQPKVSEADKKELASGISKGPADAKIVLTEFADFQCPSCAATVPVLNQLEKEFGDKYRLVFKNFPLTQIHKNAMPAAHAGEAANAQGKFWELYQILYARQDQWSKLGDPIPKFVEYGKEIGLDTAKFESDIKKERFADKIKTDMALGEKLGVPGTPTFFLNGVLVEVQDENTLKQKLQEAIANQGS